MAVRKIAISLPEDVLQQVDRLAKRTRTSRSGYIAQVLSRVSHASSQAEITAQINALFKDSDLSEEQSSVANDYLRAAESGSEGSEW